MTAKIIAFPSADPPPVKTPKITRESVKDEIMVALIHHLYGQGLRLEDLPADMDTDMRERMVVILQVIEQGQRS